MPYTLQHFEFEMNHDGLRITRYTGPDSITKVVVPAIIDGQSVTEIGEWAFYQKVGIQSVELPWTLKVIGEEAFRDCFNLRRINIPEGLTAILHAGFKMCIRLKPLVLPQSLERIGEEAFLGCEKLNRVEFRSKTTEIHPFAFGHHPELTFVCFEYSTAWRYKEYLEPDHPIHREPFPDSINYTGDRNYGFLEN